MAVGLLGHKVGMTQIFDETGRAVAVTVVAAGPCTVTQVREPLRHGYRAVQVGFEEKAQKRVSKPMQGHFKKAGTAMFRYVREFRTGEGEDYQLGQQVTVEVFKEGELVDVTGTSIGRGFQGGVKRWNWSGGDQGHGSMSHRAPGSIGASASPSRVLRGHHLPGHMGNARVTVQNLRIAKIDRETNTLLIEGSVPGAERRLVVIKRSVKRPGVIAGTRGEQVEVAEEDDRRGKKGKKRA